MTVAIFKDGMVGIQMQAAAMEGVYYSIVADNFERYFSKYGFAIPLKTHELDYVALIENRLPQFPSNYEDCSSSVSWAVIDHYGSVWQIDFFTDRENAEYNRKKLAYFSIPFKGVTTVVCPDDGDKELLIGFITACDDIKKINNYIYEKKLGRGYKMHWLNIDNIVEVLNTRYPLQKQ